MLIREVQTEQSPPYDSPWCFFDLAEIKLYIGDGQAFLGLIPKAIEYTESDWQAAPFFEGLQLLNPAAPELPDLKKGIDLLKSLLT